MSTLLKMASIGQGAEIAGDEQLARANQQRKTAQCLPLA
jgi:hypothetical protein